MAWQFQSDRPVYLQISDRIMKSVLSGDYSPGEQIPSVRQLAMDAAVNPNTIQHAFAELETSGIITSKGTLGRFVTEDREILEKNRKRMADDLAKSFIKNAALLGICDNAIIDLIKENLS